MLVVINAMVSVVAVLSSFFNGVCKFVVVLVVIDIVSESRYPLIQLVQ